MRACIRIAVSALAVALCTTRVAAQSDDGRIGVYADLTATQTSAVFSLGVPRTLFVVATLDGQTAGGMTGAEFRIDGMPEDWLVFVTPNPAANITLGNPFRVLGDTHRANIVFPFCTAGTERRVLLYTAVVIAQSAIEPRDLSVEVGNPPTSPMYTTPVLQRCDPPNYTSVPLPRTTFRLETRAPHDLDYSQLPGYDGVNGVVPEQGQPGELFRFRVIYSSNDVQLADGSPRVELDANGDDDTDDPYDAVFTLSPADQDSTLGNGKEYRFDVALGEPPGGQYRYRFSGIDSRGATVPGAATAWRSLIVDDDLADLAVYAQDIRITPSNLQPGERGSVVVRVRNLSGRRVDGVTVRVENLDGVALLERTLASMGPYSSTEVGGNINGGDLGAHALTAIVDPGTGIPETDENNNQASHGFAVGGASVGLPHLVVGGLPSIVTVPPIAQFAFTGHVEHATNSTPHPPMRGGSVVYRPAWEAARSTRTDGAGAFLTQFIAPATPGTYPITFVASDGSQTDSTTIQITVAPLPGGALPHAPNLVMQLAASIGAGCPATSAMLVATVVNLGDRTSDPTTVRIVQDGTAPVTELNLGPLTAGATAVLGAVQATLTASGLHAFTAHVDPGSEVHEFREDDNAAVASVRVSPACLDLALEAMRYTTTRMCAGESIGVLVRVVNRGCVTSQPSRVAFRAGGVEVGSAALGNLAAGATADLAFSRGFSPPGCHDLDFVLDPEGASGDDCDAESNALSAALCAGDCAPPTPPQPPNFRVVSCDIRAQNARPALGEQIRFEAWIENTSTQQAPTAVPVRFEVDGIALVGTIPVGPLGPGQRLLVQSPGTWTVDFESHQVAVVIDPQRVVPETNESDNVATRGLPWEFHPKFIARCPPANPAMFSVCQPCINQPFQIRAVVENNGLFDCDSVAVAFIDVMHGHNVIGRTVARDLPAGNDCNTVIQPVSIQHSLLDPSVHYIAAAVDPDNVLAELDETNNSYEQQIQAGCGEIPDLVAAVRLPVGTFPEPGDTIEAVEVTIRNIGTAASAAVQARVKLDGMTLCDLEMGDLAPGASRTVVCTTPWVVGEDACSQRLEACADPNNRIGELNEFNNCATGGVTGGPDTDLAIFPWTIRVTPPDPVVNEQVLLEIGLYSLRGVESSCDLIVEWSFGEIGAWFPLGEVPLHLPPSQNLLPNAATLTWAPPILPARLRFRLENVCPTDLDPTNNVAIGSLPWFVAPNTPILVSDLEARSTSDGVVVRWKAEPGLEAFALERRSDEARDWQRLPDRIAAATSSGLASYEAIDHDAEPGARLEYRLIGVEAGGHEEVLGSVFVDHNAAVRVVQLHAVRPNPFRPGSAIEYSIPERRNVQLNVFDAAGRRVAALRSGPQTAGRHAVTWDGRDDRGRSAPAGVYFCQLRADSFQQIRRFVLLH